MPDNNLYHSSIYYIKPIKCKVQIVCIHLVKVVCLKMSSALERPGEIITDLFTSKFMIEVRILKFFLCPVN